MYSGVRPKAEEALRVGVGVWNLGEIVANKIDAFGVDEDIRTDSDNLVDYRSPVEIALFRRIRIYRQLTT